MQEKEKKERKHSWFVHYELTMATCWREILSPVKFTSVNIVTRDHTHTQIVSAVTKLTRALKVIQVTLTRFDCEKRGIIPCWPPRVRLSVSARH